MISAFSLELPAYIATYLIGVKEEKEKDENAVHSPT